ncbi:MAG: sel1 repeat family protein [Magnetococcales bacterium]|nr:sel1 repeat family protein [Magnetococcales bacterium]
MKAALLSFVLALFFLMAHAIHAEQDQSVGQGRSAVARTGSDDQASEAALREGVQVFRAGDVVRAQAILLPLAKNGRYEAQFYLGLSYLKNAASFRVQEDVRKATIPGEAQQMEPPQHSFLEPFLSIRSASVTASQEQSLLSATSSSTSTNGTAAAQAASQQVGHSLPKDKPIQWEKALAWLQDAAGRGLSLAQSAKGVIYADNSSENVSFHDVRESLRWLHQAAERGYIPAQLALGELYGDGQKMPRNHQLALQWYRQAAEQGDAVAQYQLGRYHYMGYGVDPNMATAFYWFQKSAMSDDLPAQAIVGHMYHRGFGVPINVTEAERWYRQAAEQGNATAQGGLGILLFERNLARQDKLIAAYQWLKLGIEGGRDDARSYLQNLLGRMTPEQVAEAEQLLAQYRKSIHSSPSSN